MRIESRSEDTDSSVWPPDPDRDPALPLATIRVLDLSRILAGPLAAQVLGDLGADVVKVERPQVGDETRRWGPPFHGPDASYFYAFNRNRRAIELDLGSPDGAYWLRRLIAVADVVIENFLPHQYEELGLEDARAANPHTVWISIRGAARGGPLAALPGFDAMVQARSGLMSVTGPDAEHPTKVGVPFADIVTGLHAATAALAALIGSRDRPERPAPHVEVPLLECAVASLAHQGANFLITGSVPAPIGNDHPNIVPYGAFPAADRPIMVGVGNNAHYEALCTAIGRAELIADPKFATNADRITNRAELTRQLSVTLTTRPAADWALVLDEAGVPYAPINRIDEALREPQLQATGLLQQVDTEAGPLTLVGCPVTIDGVRPPIRRSPPPLGADNTDLLPSPRTHAGIDPEDAA